MKFASNAAAFLILRGHYAARDFAQLPLGVFYSGNVLTHCHQTGTPLQLDSFSGNQQSAEFTKIRAKLKFLIANATGALQLLEQDLTLSCIEREVQLAVGMSDDFFAAASQLTLKGFVDFNEASLVQ